MQEFAKPENYQGSNLLTIKKIAETIRLENNKVRQYNSLYPKNESFLKEERFLRRYSTQKDTPVKHINEIRNKRLDYGKLLSSNKSLKYKHRQFILNHDLLQVNENANFPIEATNVPSSSLMQPKSSNFLFDPKFVFGMIYNRKTEMEIKKKARILFKWAIKMVCAWLRYLNRAIKISLREQPKYLVAIQTISDFDNSDSNVFTFNKHHFKATKEIELTPEMRKILTLPLDHRTEEQILMVMYGLSALSSFNEYPVHLKKKLCTVAYFRKIDARRVIIRQGHIAEYFYFIISGTAIVTITSPDNSGHVRTVNSLSKGCSFGELALLHHSRRTASVVSLSSMQLLAIERNDFFNIFMLTPPEFSKYPDHVSFIKEIPIFSHLNLDHLVNQVEACLYHFYKNLTVISTNDIESEWVYIVKSGSCTVLKELQVPVESKLIRENTLTLRDINSKIQCYEEYYFVPMPIDECLGNIKSKTRYMWKSPTMLKTGDYFYLKNESDNKFHDIQEFSQSKNYISVFIKIADLIPKDIYGLSSVIFSDEDKVRTENMASVALVSNRAEMVLISKRFLAQKSNEHLIKDIRQGLTQYPSEKVFLNNYNTSVQWDKYKIQRYHSTLKKIN